MEADAAISIQLDVCVCVCVCVSSTHGQAHYFVFSVTSDASPIWLPLDARKHGHRCHLRKPLLGLDSSHFISHNHGGCLAIYEANFGICGGTSSHDTPDDTPCYDSIVPSLPPGRNQQIHQLAAKTHFAIRARKLWLRCDGGGEGILILCIYIYIVESSKQTMVRRVL